VVESFFGRYVDDNNHFLSMLVSLACLNSPEFHGFVLNLSNLHEYFLCCFCTKDARALGADSCEESGLALVHTVA